MKTSTRNCTAAGATCHSIDVQRQRPCANNIAKQSQAKTATDKQRGKYDPKKSIFPYFKQLFCMTRSFVDMPSMHHIALFGFQKSSTDVNLSREQPINTQSVVLEVNVNLSLSIKVEYDLSHAGSVLSFSNAIG